MYAFCQKREKKYGFYKFKKKNGKINTFLIFKTRKKKKRINFLQIAEKSLRLSKKQKGCMKKIMGKIEFLAYGYVWNLQVFINLQNEDLQKSNLVAELVALQMFNFSFIRSYRIRTSMSVTINDFY